MISSVRPLSMIALPSDEHCLAMDLTGVFSTALGCARTQGQGRPAGGPKPPYQSHSRVASTPEKSSSDIASRSIQK